MHMWGEMMTKREELEFLALITSYVLEMLANEDDHALDMVPYTYVDMDWRGFLEIFFTLDEPPDEC